MRQENPPLRHLVVATDFSEPADRGLAWGIELAQRHDARLHLVHGVVWSAALALNGGPVVDLQNEVLARTRRRMDELVRKIPSGVGCEQHLDFGQPSEVVQRVAEAVDAELIVVGTRGHGALRTLLLGSTAARIVRHAKCPVLSVHPDDPGVPSTEAPALLAPTDLEPGSESRIAEAIRLLGVSAEKSTIRLVHAFPFPAQLELYGLETQTIAIELRDQERTILQDRLEEIARSLRELGYRTESRLVDGAPTPTILDASESWGADVILMGTHGRRGLSHLVLGSTAERVVQQAHRPVLTMRQRD